MEFTLQNLGSPFLGQHVGLSHYDLNQDGLPDILVASGRHWIDQSYVKFNLGNGNFSDRALPLGDPGGYYQVDVMKNRFLDDDHVGVLLVGGTCEFEKENQYGRCEYGTHSPAVLLDVEVRDCDVDLDHHVLSSNCELLYEEIWRDPNPQGDRNGGFDYGLGNDDDDPAIVLVGCQGVKLFLPQMNESQEERRRIITKRTIIPTYSDIGPDYHHEVSTKDRTLHRDPRSDQLRYAGYATGTVIDPINNNNKIHATLVLGARSDYDEPPNPNLILIRNATYHHSSSSSSSSEMFYSPLSNDPTKYNISGGWYAGNSSYALQTTGISMVDVDGDGIEDILASNYLYEDQIVDGFGLPQYMYLLGKGGEVRESQVLYEAKHGGRSVDFGQIYHGDGLWDVVFADADGSLVLLENMGRGGRDGDEFLGFEVRDHLFVDEGDQKHSCQIRDVDVVSALVPCYDVSIVCAVTCGWEDGSWKDGGVYIFHGKRMDEENIMIDTMKSL